MAGAIVVAVVVLGGVLLARTGGPPSVEAAWRLRLGGSVVGPLALDGRSVIVTTADGSVVAVDPAEGQARWRFEPGAPALGAAVAGAGIAFLATAGADERSVIFALDTRTGGERWRMSTGLTSPSGLAVGDGVLHVADGQIVTVDAVTGSERWRRRVEGASGALAASEGILTVVTREGLAAYDSTTGAPRWTWRAPQRPARRPAIGNGVVVTDDGASTVVAIDARTGGERWRMATGALVQAPTMAGPLAVVATSEGVVVVDAATGETLWEKGPTGRDDLRAAGDGTHVAHLAGELVVRAAATGATVGTADLEDLGGDPEAPAVLGAIVVVPLAGVLQGHPLR